MGSGQYPGTLEYLEFIQHRPDVVGRLDYLRRDTTGLTGKARYRAEQKDVWLPDDLSIAEIPSGRVREYVTSALEKFYGSNLSSHKDPSCI